MCFRRLFSEKGSMASKIGLGMKEGYYAGINIRDRNYHYDFFIL